MKKNKITKQDIIIINIIIVLSCLHLLFFNSDAKLDIYLFYNHERYISNIVRDLEIYGICTLLTYRMYFYNQYYLALLVFNIIQIICYFLFYSKLEALVAIPIYIFTLIILYIKNKK